jgi:RimJ/RimL family protein N-acetyltransferase
MARHIVLETERLILRRFTGDDVDHLVELDSDPEVMRYLTGDWAPDDTLTLTGVEPVDADTARARFRWDHDGTGTMLLRFRDGEPVDLEIMFET